MPYEVGRYREQWAHYPALQRQFHPDVNGGVALSQIPPAADVLLLWTCEIGHRFAATPWEQRQRPTGSRRRSTWCPECAARAGGDRSPRSVRSRSASGRRASCGRSPAASLTPGSAFRSPCAPPTASAAEAELRALLCERLDLGLTAPERPNAIRTRTAFFDHLEVWPDVILEPLSIAIEYDSTGRDGLEHVGRRESVDRRKDRLLREVGWQVIRVRTGHLPDLGPYDLAAAGVSARLADRLVERLAEVSGSLLVEAYRR